VLLSSFCQVFDSRINNATAVLRGLINLLIDQQPSLVSHVQKKHDQDTKKPFEDVNASLDYLHHEEIFGEHEFTQKKAIAVKPRRERLILGQVFGTACDVLILMRFPCPQALRLLLRPYSLSQHPKHQPCPANSEI
jgi:hypothetical protein